MQTKNAPRGSDTVINASLLKGMRKAGLSEPMTLPHSLCYHHIIVAKVDNYLFRCHHNSAERALYFCKVSVASLYVSFRGLPSNLSHCESTTRQNSALKITHLKHSIVALNSSIYFYYIQSCPSHD